MNIIDADTMKGEICQPSVTADFVVASAEAAANQLSII